MRTYTKEIQNSITPNQALNTLKDGNDRFVHNTKIQRNLHDQMEETSKGQFPFAVILSCIDSRAPVETIFDQGIGSVFSIRVAGNVINEDVLGSLEYACRIAGSKILVILGHTKCGAVTAACSNVQLGNITSLLSKIKPAVDQFRSNDNEKVEGVNIEKVSLKNVELSKERILDESTILRDMEKGNEILIVKANYDISTGKVMFFED